VLTWRIYSAKRNVFVKAAETQRGSIDTFIKDLCIAGTLLKLNFRLIYY